MSVKNVNVPKESYDVLRNKKLSLKKVTKVFATAGLALAITVGAVNTVSNMVGGAVDQAYMMYQANHIDVMETLSSDLFLKEMLEQTTYQVKTNDGYQEMSCYEALSLALNVVDEYNNASDYVKRENAENFIANNMELSTKVGLMALKSQCAKIINAEENEMLFNPSNTYSNLIITTKSNGFEPKASDWVVQYEKEVNRFGVTLHETESILLDGQLSKAASEVNKTKSSNIENGKIVETFMNALTNAGVVSSMDGVYKNGIFDDTIQVTVPKK